MDVLKRVPVSCLLYTSTGHPELKSLGDLGKRLQHQDRVICLV